MKNEIKKAFTTIHQASHLAATQIFMLDNYADKLEYRNTEKDLKYWKILEKAMDEAKRQIKMNRVVSPTVPIITSTVIPTTISKPNKCQISSCPNFGKIVEFPNCPYCGKPALPDKDPVLIVPMLNTIKSSKICGTQNCTNYGKEVSYPKCPHCGVDPISQLSKQKVCIISSCTNFGKPVDFPRCPYCGNPTGDSLPKVRKCQNPVCSNHGNEVQKEFKFCPFCGFEPILT